MPSEKSDDLLSRQVYVEGRYAAFGELTADDARAMAEELSGHSGGGLEKHMTPVAIAWRELAALLDQPGTSSVADLDSESATRFAERLRVVPPGGSWL